VKILLADQEWNSNKQYKVPSLENNMAFKSRKISAEKKTIRHLSAKLMKFEVI